MLAVEMTARSVFSRTIVARGDVAGKASGGPDAFGTRCRNIALGRIDQLSTFLKHTGIVSAATAANYRFRFEDKRDFEVDATIPTSAAALLDLIGSKEAPEGYGTIFGNNQSKLHRPLTSMTVAEVVAGGPSWAKLYGSSACGRYQFLTATLKGLRTSESLSGSEIFAPDFQDRLGYALLEQCGYERFLRNQLSVTGFALALAKEWASFPVLEDCQGAHRFVQRGETYYAGDKLNKALITPEVVETALADHPKALAASTITSILSAANEAITATATTVSFDSPLPNANYKDPGETTRSIARDDGSLLKGLIALASDSDRLQDAQATAAEKLLKYDGEVYPRDGCAITLSVLLQRASINVPDVYQALALGNVLMGRGWSVIPVGEQKDGDVGSTCGKLPKHGRDHIYLVLQVSNSDEMVIADNQESRPHFRFASGHGKTPTKFFLRAPGAATS